MLQIYYFEVFLSLYCWFIMWCFQSLFAIVWHARLLVKSLLISNRVSSILSWQVCLYPHFEHSVWCPQLLNVSSFWTVLRVLKRQLFYKICFSWLTYNYLFKTFISNNLERCGDVQKLESNRNVHCKLQNLWVHSLHAVIMSVCLYICVLLVTCMSKCCLQWFRSMSGLLYIRLPENHENRKNLVQNLVYYFILCCSNVF